MNKNRRADRRVGGIFPELSRPPTQRAAVQSKNKPWTNAEEAVAIAAICACKNREAYDLMVPHLMDVIGHAPTYSARAKPSPRVHTDTCIRALELRVVSKMLAGWNGWKPTGYIGFHQIQSQIWLTWGERVKIVKPWAVRLHQKKAVLPLHDVSKMLGRFSIHDANALNVYIDALKRTCFQINEREVSGFVPINEKNKDKIRRAMEEPFNAEWLNRLLGFTRM